jgi:hypothetical protein
VIYRLIRGANADYHGEEFDDESLRDSAAQAYAKQDGDEVLLEYLDPETHQWWCTGAAYPPGQEPVVPDPNTRWTAVAVMPGDDATIFGCTSGMFGAQTNTDHRGTVLRKHLLEELHYGIDGWRFEFTDGRVIDCIDHAVATIHDVDVSERFERYGDTGEEA